MIPNFTGRARRYVQRTPQLQIREMSSYKRERLIKGIARLMSETYRQGYKEGKGNLNAQ